MVCGVLRRRKIFVYNECTQTFAVMKSEGSFLLEPVGRWQMAGSGSLALVLTEGTEGNRRVGPRQAIQAMRMSIQLGPARQIS